MAANETILSAGLLLSEILNENAAVKAIASKVYPVVANEATLPYVVWRRTNLTKNPTKSQGADTADIEVDCYGSTYAESVQLAEAVQAALDYRQMSNDHLRLRSCYLTESSESWLDDAYQQQLIFTIKI